MVRFLRITVPDFGIFYAPFMFDTWDEEWSAVDSDWYRGLCDELAQKASIRVLSSNWIYRARNILSVKPVTLPEDLAGPAEMRVSSNDLSISSFNSWEHPLWVWIWAMFTRHCRQDH